MEVKYAQTYSYELVWGEFYPPDGMLLHLEMDGKSYGLNKLLQNCGKIYVVKVTTKL